VRLLRYVPSISLALQLWAGCLWGCASTPGPSPSRVSIERPEDALFRIAGNWRARHSEKGLRSSPSPIGAFDRQIVSRLALSRGQATATETVRVTESFLMREGGRVSCSVDWEGEVTVAYGTLRGEAALQLGWEALQRPRACDDPNLALPPFERPAGRAAFVLRSDQLVGIDPPLEKRIFLPED
jgi:hypothetical protein